MAMEGSVAMVREGSVGSLIDIESMSISPYSHRKRKRQGLEVTHAEGWLSVNG
jgi:hypothetical protein